jgi:pyridoxamine 5'-phosphate oxidase
MTERDPATPTTDDLLRRLEAYVAEARAAGAPIADACCLSTATPDGRPSARMLIFKGVDDGRVTFATNYGSRKGLELDRNPRAALTFWWPQTDRQVRIEGAVVRLSAGGSDAIHAARPRGSQVSVWASDQSRPVEDRGALQARRDEVEQRFEGVDPIPRPESWGGYALVPDAVEFWQASEDRFHHRERFVRTGEAWTSTVLQP